MASENGVFASNDGGKTWSAENEGPANCSVQQIFFDATTLYAVTHGRGLFRLDLSRVRAR